MLLNQNMNIKNEITSDWFLREPQKVARELIGKLFVRQSEKGEEIGGIITETEAYLARDDESSHSFRGETPRNGSMFAKAGSIYVYRSYGIHFCINIATERAGIGSAVLLRALEPLLGIEQMKINRGIADEIKLCKGPGNLTRALGVNLDDNFDIISESRFRLYDINYHPTIDVTPRIGISKSKDLLLRFIHRGSKFLSR